MGNNQVQIESEFLTKKDKASFEILFKSNYQALVRYAFLYLKEKEASEEIVQDVFLTIWEKRDDLLVTSSLKSYLFRAVYNKCMNQLKNIQYRETYKEYNQKMMIETEKDGYDKVVEEEVLDKIKSAIENLPDERKKVFKLVKEDGLKYKEVADQLNISIKTVENQMGSALKFLRNQLSDFMTIIILILFRI